VRKLRIRSVEIAVVEQYAQAAQQILLAAAVECGKVLRAYEAMPGDMAEDREIARRQLAGRRLFLTLKPPGP
jgi:hypothetical protein